jgi:hypothetical protein
MEAASELESVDNYPVADTGTSVSPTVWSTINFLDEAVTSLLDPVPYASASGGTRQSASAN